MGTTERFYTLNQAEKRLGTYSQLIRRLLEVHAIPTMRIGNAIVLSQSAFDQLREALERWRCRPRMASRRPVPRLQRISE